MISLPAEICAITVYRAANGRAQAVVWGATLGQPEDPKPLPAEELSNRKYRKSRPTEWGRSSPVTLQPHLVEQEKLSEPYRKPAIVPTLCAAERSASITGSGLHQRNPARESLIPAVYSSAISSVRNGNLRVTAKASRRLPRMPDGIQAMNIAKSKHPRARTGDR